MLRLATNFIFRSQIDLEVKIQLCLNLGEAVLEEANIAKIFPFLTNRLTIHGCVTYSKIEDFLLFALEKRRLFFSDRSSKLNQEVWYINFVRVQFSCSLRDHRYAIGGLDLPPHSPGDVAFFVVFLIHFLRMFLAYLLPPIRIGVRYALWEGSAMVSEKFQLSNSIFSISIIKCILSFVILFNIHFLFSPFGFLFFIAI